MVKTCLIKHSLLRHFNGETDIDFTMMYPESHLELVTTGSAHVESNQSAGQVYGNAKYVINNQDEYQLRGLVGGNASRSGAQSSKSAIW